MSGRPDIEVAGLCVYVDETSHHRQGRHKQHHDEGVEEAGGLGGGASPAQAGEEAEEAAEDQADHQAGKVTRLVGRGAQEILIQIQKEVDCSSNQTQKYQETEKIQDKEEES